MDEIGKFDGISDEKDGGVVSDHIPVALFRVELQGKSPDITDRIRRPLFSRDGGEASEDLRLFTDLRKYLRLCVLCDILSYRQDSVRPGCFRMDDPLRDTLAVEMRQLFEEMMVLDQSRASFSGREGILIIADRYARRGCQFLFFTHFELLFSIFRLTSCL